MSASTFFTAASSAGDVTAAPGWQAASVRSASSDAGSTMRLRMFMQPPCLRLAMTDGPYVGSDGVHIRGLQRRGTQRRHRTDGLLRGRHALHDGALDAGEAAVAPDP